MTHRENESSNGGEVTVGSDRRCDGCEIDWGAIFALDLVGFSQSNLNYCPTCGDQL